jgi:uncharacterized protein (TIGR03083 family)
MTDRLPAIDLPNMVAALRSERTEMLDFTRSLTDDEWRAPSAAAGWSIADVVGHIAATAHNFYAPSLEILRTKDLEASNEGPVERRRSWTRERVMTEYEKSSRRAISLVNAIRRSPAARLRFSLAELGRYPIGLMISGALVFDHHTHLRHDMAPALGRPVPATDADRMRAVLTWMTAVLSNQVAHAPVDGLDARIALTLTGPGGGTWWIDEAGVLTPVRRQGGRAHHRPCADLPRLGHAAVVLARKRRHSHRRRPARRPLPGRRQRHLIRRAPKRPPHSQPRTAGLQRYSGGCPTDWPFETAPEPRCDLAVAAYHSVSLPPAAASSGRGVTRLRIVQF